MKIMRVAVLLICFLLSAQNALKALTISLPGNGASYYPNEDFTRGLDLNYDGSVVTISLSAAGNSYKEFDGGSVSANWLTWEKIFNYSGKP